MSKPKLGTGARFAQLTKELEAQGKSEESAKAIAATVGRKKYGTKRMAKWAAKGRHGMQMGPNGFGLTHGYDDGDDADMDNSHEYKGCK